MTTEEQISKDFFNLLYNSKLELNMDLYNSLICFATSASNKLLATLYPGGDLWVFQGEGTRRGEVTNGVIMLHGLPVYWGSVDFTSKTVKPGTPVSIELKLEFA